MIEADNTPPTAPGELRPLAVRARHAAKLLGIGETALWSWTNQGRIPHIKLGKCTLYPVAALEAWLAEQVTKGVRRDPR